jgi:hypothetical protein
MKTMRTSIIQRHIRGLAPGSALLLAGLCGAAQAASVDELSKNVDIYGYMAWRMEKVWNEPQNDAGTTLKEDSPRELSLPSFNLMLQSRSGEQVKTFVNIGSTDGQEVELRNLWGEYRVSQYLSLRLGKTYRRFGLYNELLDAVPTYIGIEPPELFDKDHLILSRTALFMAHGWVALGDGELQYSWLTDNGEGGATGDAVPMNVDLRYTFGLGNYTIGVSGYTSNGDTVSDVALGDGSPRSGVLPWMASDDFSVLGAYAEADVGNWQLQAEYWHAKHDAVRDADSIVAVIDNAGVNDNQRARFLVNPAGPVNAGNVNTNGDYGITTWYLRAGYSFPTARGELVPYAQWDYYDNPETIYNKDWGGDAEAGLADNGKFSKATIGVIYRPQPTVAFKFDASTHFQKVNGSSEPYSEVRFDVSYIFGR